jgi:hypothetical protein
MITRFGWMTAAELVQKYGVYADDHATAMVRVHMPHNAPAAAKWVEILTAILIILDDSREATRH